VALGDFGVLTRFKSGEPRIGFFFGEMQPGALKVIPGVQDISPRALPLIALGGLFSRIPHEPS
jgi:hypothetical protein